MVWLELGVISAMAVCDGTLFTAVYYDYSAQKKAGKVKGAGEYFWGKY
jgi:hypothetical protein